MKSITTVIPNNVVEKAIEGGWRDNKIRYQQIRAVTGTHMIPVEVVALDPIFWQALGKSLGWREATHIVKEDIIDDWLKTAHRFYDLILQGQSTDDFWKELLAN
jgi:hypothetical protein